MADLNRMRVLWTGGYGGPGVSTFYTNPAVTTALADIAAFFNAIKAFWPAAIGWEFPAAGDTIESTTGTLTGGWTSGAVAGFSGTQSGAFYAAGVGARVVWGTNVIFNGRRLKGSTYLTDVYKDAYASDGTMASAWNSTVGTAADTLVATGALVVWHRPSPGGSNGGFADVESRLLPDKVTALRSRRN